MHNLVELAINGDAVPGEYRRLSSPLWHRAAMCVLARWRRWRAALSSQTASEWRPAWRRPLLTLLVGRQTTLLTRFDLQQMSLFANCGLGASDAVQEVQCSASQCSAVMMPVLVHCRQHWLHSPHRRHPLRAAQPWRPAAQLPRRRPRPACAAAGGGTGQRRHGGARLWTGRERPHGGRNEAHEPPVCHTQRQGPPQPEPVTRGHRGACRGALCRLPRLDLELARHAAAACSTAQCYMAR